MAERSEDGRMRRYRYRAYPTPAQKQMLAQTFGCARVVYNDAVRCRHNAFAAGERISDSEVQRRVVTLAKHTPERAWLGDVPGVTLVQACRDARQAYRNWFDSMSGRRTGGLVGHPRMHSRKDRQTARFSGGYSFRVTARGVRLCKVGVLRLRWSRTLPSVPSSVTIIREADGRYYASFVVVVPDIPLPVVTTDVGIDLGIERLVVTSAGDVVENPHHLRRRAKAIARSRRNLARKQEGSKNRAKAARRVAVHHRKVREARLDAHHKLALRLVRENQTVYVEDMAISPMARTRMAESVYDAGWATLVRLIEEKAARHHRQVVKVSRWFPSSQLCSTCGRLDGPKGLDVRSWTCAGCGAVHDRDINAARNILAEGRKVAAGLADTENACGGDLRRGRTTPRSPVKQESRRATRRPHGRPPRWQASQ